MSYCRWKENAKKSCQALNIRSTEDFSKVKSGVSIAVLIKYYHNKAKKMEIKMEYPHEMC